MLPHINTNGSNLESRRYQINPHLNQIKIFTPKTAKTKAPPIDAKITKPETPTGINVSEVAKVGQQLLAHKPTIGSMNIRRIPANYDSH